MFFLIFYLKLFSVLLSFHCKQLLQGNLFITVRTCPGDACSVFLHVWMVCNCDLNTELYIEAPCSVRHLCPSVSRVHTSPFCEVYIQSFLVATEPGSNSPPPQARLHRVCTHTASCSGENCSHCLPGRETARLQVLNILFKEEVLDGSPECLCLSLFPPATHRRLVSCISANTGIILLSNSSQMNIYCFCLPLSDY